MSPAAEGVGAAELGVKVAVRRGQLVDLFVIEVEVLDVIFGALVDQFDEGAYAEGHGCVAVEGAAGFELVVPARRGGEKLGLVGVDECVAQAEEVTQGREHAGMVGVVPGDFEQAVAVVVALRHPDMGEEARTADVGEHTRFA